jgi:mRNA interferase MazF
MTAYEQGDVLLVPLSFHRSKRGKATPGVVLSHSSYNQAHPDVILAPVTSQVSHGSDEVNLADWSSSGLVKPSIVKPVLSSFYGRLVRRKLGALSATDLAQVRAFFARILDLT